ncbi:MAG: 4-hydroxy-tetrahydrodipicolinate reductase, partial [Pseudomonadota bacterium]|nr:4-hydroxy-tetrahydrodipicolinate reductase [Pseudomonadota bacterium]
MTIRVALSGAAGSMGLRVGAALAAADDIEFVWGLVRSSQLSTDGCLAPLSDDVDQVISDCDVLFDFT